MCERALTRRVTAKQVLSVCCLYSSRHSSFQLFPSFHRGFPPVLKKQCPLSRYFIAVFIKQRHASSGMHAIGSPRIQVFRRKPESGGGGADWMPDQVRHDEMPSIPRPLAKPCHNAKDGLKLIFSKGPNPSK